ncbi:MAG: DVU0150 family protein [Desulfobacteria bacterium]
MFKLWTKITGVMVMALFVISDIALAAAEKASPLVIVADTRILTGWQAWFANLYNESHLYFTLLTVAIIPIVGVLLGLLADLVMSRIGIDLKSRELSEH